MASTGEAVREQARAEAVARIKRTLNSAEEPERVESLRQSRQAQLSAAKSKLAASLSRTVGDLAHGKHLLQQSKERVHHVRSNFEQVQSLCESSAQSQSLAQRHHLTTFAPLSPLFSLLLKSDF